MSGYREFPCCKVGPRSAIYFRDAKSWATHPADTALRQFSSEALVQSGVCGRPVQLCMGIEHIGDLLADLGTALVTA